MSNNKVHIPYHSAIFIDLDGTLVMRDGSIPEKAITSLNEAQSKGYMIVIATGRMYRSALKEAARIGVNEDSAIISYNGALAAKISNINDVMYSNNISGADFYQAIGILDKYKNHDITVFCYSHDELLVDRENDLLAEYTARTGAKYKKIKNFQTLNGSPKILAITKPEKPQILKIIANEFMEKMADKVECAFSFEHYFEINAKNVTKGHAIKKISEYYKVPFENTFAIGDSFNDIEMFGSVKTSIAMGNAAPEVQKRATFVTSDISNDGIFNAVNKFILNKKNAVN